MPARQRAPASQVCFGPSTHKAAGQLGHRLGHRVVTVRWGSTAQGRSAQPRLGEYQARESSYPRDAPGRDTRLPAVARGSGGPSRPCATGSASSARKACVGGRSVHYKFAGAEARRRSRLIWAARGVRARAAGSVGGGMVCWDAYAVCATPETGRRGSRAGEGMRRGGMGVRYQAPDNLRSGAVGRALQIAAGKVHTR